MPISRRDLMLSAPSLALAGRAFAKGRDVPETTRFGGARFRFPHRNTQVSVSAGNLAILSDVTFVTPAFPTRDHQFIYSGYWFENGASYEVTANNPYPVMASISIAGSAPVRLPFGRSVAPHSVLPDANDWTDRGVDSTIWTPPCTPINIRTLTWLTDGQWRMGGIDPNQGSVGYREGCVISNNYEDLVSLLDGGTPVYNTFGANGAMVAPSMVVCRAAASNRSVLVPGDSIAKDWRAITYDANNNRGHMARGLHNAGFAMNDIAFAGCKIATEGSSGPNASMVKRAAAINLLPERPFDTILLDGGTNDIATHQTFETLAPLYSAEVSRFRSLFGADVRIVLQTMLPKTNGSFTTASGQVPWAHCDAGGVLYQMNNALLTPSDFGADGVLDLGPVMAARNNPDATDPLDVWRYDGGTATVDGVHLTDHGSDIATAAVTAAAMGGVI